MLFFFFFKQKTAYEMRISDWSSDVCSSDLPGLRAGLAPRFQRLLRLLYKRGNGNPWVTDAKFEAIRRYLAVHAALRPIQGQREILALVGLESRTSIVVGRLALHPGTGRFGTRASVPARGSRLDG